MPKLWGRLSRKAGSFPARNRTGVGIEEDEFPSGLNFWHNRIVVRRGEDFFERQCMTG
jgi:hypothetical protein